MSDNSRNYRVVFWGAVLLGQKRAAVARRFVKRFKITRRSQLRQLFSGRMVVMKKGMTYAEAKVYSDLVRGMGAVCRLEQEFVPPALSSLSSTEQQSASERRLASALQLVNQRQLQLVEKSGEAKPETADFFARFTSDDATPSKKSKPGKPTLFIVK